ncbi:MAG TPA: CDP-glycerol glycerophosphotransferase family protein, partial [Candidatus Limnocylindrales bacterium]
PATTVIQVWHAAGAFKKMGYSLSGKSFGGGAALLDRVAVHSNYDLCLVSSRAVAPQYAEAFRLPLDRFVSTIGLPRTDVLFGQAAAAAAARVRARYPLPEGRRVVLYAPTFRGDSGVDPDAGALLDLRVLRQWLGEDHVILLRLHPFVRAAAPIGAGLAGFVIDVSAYPEINELMLVSDVLVTDYSSAIFEYALLGRPIVFFAPDLAAYETERGFYFDYRAGVPGPVLETSEAVASYLRAGSFDLGRVRDFAAAAFDVADGRAAERFVDEIAMPMLDRERRNRR